MDFLHGSVDGKSPSGVSIPLILRQRLKQPQPQVAEASALASSHAVIQQPEIPGALSVASSIDPQSVFSSQEIEDHLLRTSQALTEIQKQIQRGEETYYEETQAYYNSSLFRGFDTIIDARAISINSHNNGMSGGGGNSNISQSGPRRMPADFRWFSSSSTSIPRHGNTKSLSITASRATQPPTSAGVVSAASQVVQIRSSGVAIVKKNAAVVTAAAATGANSGPLPPPPSSSLPPSVQPSTTGGNRGTKRCTSAPPVVATSKTATSGTTVDNSSSGAIVAAATSSAKAAGAAVPSSFEDSASAAAAAVKGEGTTAAAPIPAISASTAPATVNKTGETKSGSATKGRASGKSESGKRRPKRKRAIGTG